MINSYLFKLGDKIPEWFRPCLIKKVEFTKGVSELLVVPINAESMKQIGQNNKLHVRVPNGFNTLIFLEDMKLLLNKEELNVFEQEEVSHQYICYFCKHYDNRLNLKCDLSSSKCFKEYKN